MPKRSISDWVMEAFAAAALATLLMIVAARWSEIPARVPMHFGFSGAPDAWSGKNGMLLIPLTAIGLYLLMTTASRYQGLINLPMTIDRNAPEVQRLLQSMAIALKTAILFVFAYIAWAQVNTALGLSLGLGIMFLPIMLVAMVVPLGFYLPKLRRFRK